MIRDLGQQNTSEKIRGNWPYSKKSGTSVLIYAKNVESLYNTSLTVFFIIAREKESTRSYAWTRQIFRYSVLSATKINIHKQQKSEKEYNGDK
jgi:hypothetical protein